MKRVIIVQARMTSTRLPGKVLMDVVGTPMLTHQFNRLKRCKCADEIVIATTVNSSDDPLIKLAKQNKVGWYRGDEQDVLSRYIGAAQQFGADVVARITADCPLIDPQVVDRVFNELITNPAECDYASNIHPRTYPRGLDTEVFYMDTLMRINRYAQTSAAREHVTLVAYAERPDIFTIRNVSDNEDNSDLRWTVDTEKDLQLIRTLYSALDLGERIAPYSEILDYVRSHTEISELNKDIETWQPTQ